MPTNTSDRTDLYLTEPGRELARFAAWALAAIALAFCLLAIGIVIFVVIRQVNVFWAGVLATITYISLTLFYLFGMIVIFVAAITKMVPRREVARPTVKLPTDRVSGR